MHPSQALSLPETVQNNRFGIMGCCFMKLDFEAHCRLSAGIGVSYVETFANKLNPDLYSVEQAQNFLSAGNLELLLMIAPNLELDQPEAYLETLDGLLQYWKAVGLTNFVVLRTGRSERFADFIALMKRAGELVRSRGFTPLTQNHRGGMVESPDELLAGKAAEVELLFDTQQFQIMGHDPREAWEKLHKDIVHIHLADRFADKTSAAFGKGVIGIDRLLRRIHNVGYRGAITLEPELDDQAEGAKPFVQAAFEYSKEVLSPLAAVGTSSPGHGVHHKDDVPAAPMDWGCLHWVTSGDLFANCDQTLGFVTVKPGCANPAHVHPEDQEVIVIRSGTCRHACGDREVRLNAGDVLFIPEGQPHQAYNDGEEPCEMLVLYPTGKRGFEKVEPLIHINQGTL